jgi:hypothetical protein
MVTQKLQKPHELLLLPLTNLLPQKTRLQTNSTNHPLRLLQFNPQLQLSPVQQQ